MPSSQRLVPARADASAAPDDPGPGGRPAAEPVDATGAAALAARVEAAVGRVIRGKEEVVRLLLTALVARGHVLIEDVPGVGKTTLARALAACVGGVFRRIQFTSDLLPADIVGVSVYSQRTERFELKRGPIFANIVLADEINRSSPRTQSALLEVLDDGRVTVDDETHPVGDPFMVIATQNPVEHYGAYPLPESQLDRFLLRLVVGYPAPDEERALITERGGYDLLEERTPEVSLAEVSQVQRQVDAVAVDPDLLSYLMTVVHETRRSSFLNLGVSPRGAIAWYRAAQAYALLAGRDHCLPDDFKRLAPAALAHRVVLAAGHDPGGRDEAERVVAEILGRVPIPL